MATHKSAIKKYRRDEKRRIVNKMHRSRMRNKIKLLRKKLDAGELDEAKTLYPQVISLIDKTITKGTIHRNTGSRYKSRLSDLMRKSGIES